MLKRTITGIVAALFAVGVLAFRDTPALSIVVAIFTVIAAREIEKVIGIKNKAIYYISLVFSGLVPLFYEFRPELEQRGIIIPDNGKCKRNQYNPTVADCMYCKEASVKDGKQHNIAYNRTDNTAYRTLNSLFGTYLRAELVLSEKSSRKICKRVRKPSGKQSEQYKEQIVVEIELVGICFAHIV